MPRVKIVLSRLTGRPHATPWTQYQKLDIAEEVRLAWRWRAHGDLDAFRRLVVSQLGLPFRIAKDFFCHEANAEDLVQEGTVGLMEAVRRFDPERGTRLSTYAAWWIRAYMLDYVVDQGGQVPIGKSGRARHVFFSLNRVRHDLEQRGLDADDAALADKLGVSVETI